MRRVLILTAFLIALAGCMAPEAYAYRPSLYFTEKLWQFHRADLARPHPNEDTADEGAITAGSEPRSPA